MKDSYAPVLKMLGQRNETDSDTMVWIALILVLLPLLLLAGNYLRHFLHRRRNLAYAFDQLDKIGGAKGLTYPEQALLEKIATTAHLSNPTLLINSIEVFDRAVGAWMQQARYKPWQDMDVLVDQLTSIRHKVGFRYLPSERPPVSTRQLKIGQKVYSLAASPKGLRLIAAEIVDLDDLAIVTWPFEAVGRRVKLPPNHDIWGFFWSEGGGEYRFKTRLQKEIKRPVHYLRLHHGDDLRYRADREIFTRPFDREVVVEWIPASRYGANLSPNIFDRVEAPETLAVSLTQISGSGFMLAFDEKIDIDDLVRIKGGDNTPGFLADSIGKVLETAPEGILCKFVSIAPEAHHKLLADIARHISPDTLTRTRRASAQTVQRS